MADADRWDLGASFAAVTRRLLALEKPILERHGVSMWGYAALTALSRRPATTQIALARAIGYDKTRLIRVLDELEAGGLVERAPDPADRRAHVVSITAAGAERRRAVVREIRAMEDDVLAALDREERDVLLAVLPRLVRG